MPFLIKGFHGFLTVFLGLFCGFHMAFLWISYRFLGDILCLSFVFSLFLMPCMCLFLQPFLCLTYGTHGLLGAFLELSRYFLGTFLRLFLKLTWNILRLTEIYTSDLQSLPVSHHNQTIIFISLISFWMTHGAKRGKGRFFF